ncbi:EG45-like domain containing protein [Amborella trichopoda]|nr:EG45-like domain containing protein [Amborella trichopoda]|eukprot:XP_006845496.2 EG45-like domain containing protein [Amborella trichopoda]
MGRMNNFLVLMAFCLLSFASHAAAATGTATFYTPPYVPSSCFGFQDNGVMIAAASDAIWDNRAACGRNYRVRCTGGTNQGVPEPCRGDSVVVRVVDYCPPGCRSTIDLSQEAFSQIADPNAGVINIEYEQV